VTVDPSGFVFSSAPDGRTPFTPSQLQAMWDRLRAAAGVPDVRFHDLRHATVTQMRAAGVPVKTVGKHVGHLHAATTEDIYNSSRVEDDARAALVMGELIDGI
jgi:integrase